MVHKKHLLSCSSRRKEALIDPDFARQKEDGASLRRLLQQESSIGKPFENEVQDVIFINGSMKILWS
jgi:hypothetical protein